MLTPRLPFAGIPKTRMGDLKQVSTRLQTMRIAKQASVDSEPFRAPIRLPRHRLSNLMTPIAYTSISNETMAELHRARKALEEALEIADKERHRNTQMQFENDRLSRALRTEFAERQTVIDAVTSEANRRIAEARLEIQTLQAQKQSMSATLSHQYQTRDQTQSFLEGELRTRLDQHRDQLSEESERRLKAIQHEHQQSRQSELASIAQEHASVVEQRELFDRKSAEQQRQGALLQQRIEGLQKELMSRNKLTTVSDQANQRQRIEQQTQNETLLTRTWELFEVLASSQPDRSGPLSSGTPIVETESIVGVNANPLTQTRWATVLPDMKQMSSVQQTVAIFDELFSLAVQLVRRISEHHTTAVKPAVISRLQAPQPQWAPMISTPRAAIRTASLTSVSGFGWNAGIGSSNRNVTEGPSPPPRHLRIGSNSSIKGIASPR